MLLAIDVGNTRTKVYNRTRGDIAIFPTAKIRNHDDAAGVIGVRTDQEIQIIGASVVPRVREEIDDASYDFWGSNPIWIDASLPLGLVIKYETPDTLGADRLANALAASSLYEPPVVVVDIGTATKLEAIDEERNYLGGSILPGLQMGIGSLRGGTAQLPLIEASWPVSPIGVDTVTSLQTGTVLAHAHAIAGLIHDYEAKIGRSTVVFTGGGSDVLMIQDKVGPFSGLKIVNEPRLTLMGLEVAARRLGLVS